MATPHDAGGQAGASGPPIRAAHDLSAQQVQTIEDRLYDFNVERTGQADGLGLAFVAEREGRLVGAVAGYSWGGICELRQVWVETAERGHGLGRSLMQAALAEAAARQCRHVFLATYDFQAPRFYEGFGFQVVAEIADKPVGHTEFVMRLTF